MDRPLFSEKLAARRRELGYSTAQVANDLRLKESVLIAFEEGDFANMPKSGYAQGMLSSYARYLGLDEREMTGLFSRALNEYRHGSGRNKPVSAQPMVGRRGLLPSSGGPAGDLGTFATTTVRSRSGSADSIRTVGGYSSSTPYGGSQPVSTRPGSLGKARRATRSTGGSYGSQGAYGRSSRSAAERASRDIRRGDVKTVRVRPGEYVDDLRPGRETHPYEGASTMRGRQESRNIASPDRPNVQRRTSSRQRRELRERDQQQRRGRSGGFLGSPEQKVFATIVGLAIVIFLIIVVSVGSCTAKRTGDAGSSVPVSEATTSGSSASDATKEQSAAEAAAAKALADASSSKGSSAQTAPTETKVGVSVADGAVTWLEVECDGSSKIAETVTGPWSQTYDVTKSITIQAGDTSSVTITNNGQQVSFESRASGVGTVTIQGSGTSGAAAAETTTAQTGKASSSSEGTSGDGESADATGDEGAEAADASYGE
jgi:hypothetical protein